MATHPKIPKSEIDYIQNLQRSHTDLQRAIGRGQPTLRDAAGNIVALDPASGTPLLVAQGHDVALNMSATAGIDQGTLYVTNEDGSQPRDIVANHYYGDVGHPDRGNTPPYSSVPYNVWSDTYGVHYGNVNATTVNASSRIDAPKFYGEIGVPGQQWHAYITSHGTHDGNSEGTHYGDTHGTHYGAVSPAPKAFVIDHPSDPERRLIHACTESPNNGVEYWGTAAVKRGFARVELPDYFEKLTSVEGRTVHLTPLGTPDVVYGTYPTRGGFSILSEQTDREFEVCWLVHAVRKDIPDLLAEPRRSDVQVSGTGPYRTYSVTSEQPPRAVGRPPDLVPILWHAVGVEQARADQLELLVRKVTRQVQELASLVRTRRLRKPVSARREDVS